MLGLAGLVVVGHHVEEGGASGEGRGGRRRERVGRGQGVNPRERELLVERVGDEALFDHCGDLFVGFSAV